MTLFIVLPFLAVVFALGGGTLVDRGWYHEARRMLGIGYAFMTMAFLCLAGIALAAGMELSKWI